MTDFAALLGAEPANVASPHTPDELADAVRDAVERGHAVVPWGGGLGQDYGYPLRVGAFTLIKTSGLNRVVAVEPGDLTITVEAGATLAQVQAALLPHGLFLPLDAPFPDRATIGGILAVNVFGASRLGYGTARDWLIGLSVVNASGRITKSGGKVVKNVTGYDLPKLHIGALGTLGILAEATFKALPLPEAERTVVVELGDDSVGGVGSYIHAVLDAVSPTRFYGRRDETGTFFVAHFTGFDEVVRSEADKCVALARKSVDHHTIHPVIVEPTAHETPTGCVVLQSVSSLEEQSQAFFQTDALSRSANAVVETWYGTGVTRVCFAEVSKPALAALDNLTQIDETVLHSRALLHAPLAVREMFPVWSREPASLPLMRRVKTGLDPQGMFNPGRFVGRL